MASAPASSGTQAASSSPLTVMLTALAALVALVALAGSLYLSLGMGLKACPLCFYQRTFIMGAVAVLWLGLLLPGVRKSAVNVLALPLAVGGLGVAGFHCYLEWTGFLECPAGVFGMLSAPQQSLAAHGILVLILLAAVLAEAGRARLDVAIAVFAIVLGGLFAFGGVQSTPPSPLPKAPYPVSVDEDGCRRPFEPIPQKVLAFR